jgi:CDP-diacylglycerol---glycerol-3-phosphate 3-phosphatidyltransferase
MFLTGLNGLANAHAHRANLNKSYFTNRQDRYIRFNSQPQLAEYCRDYLRSASTFSYRLSAQSAGGYDLHWSNELHPHHFHAKAKSSLNALQASYRDKSPAISDSSDDVLVYPVIQAGQFEVREEVDCLASLFRHIATQSAHKSPGPLIDLTSGYFGLSDQYRRLVIDSDVDCRIVAASPMVRFCPFMVGLSC